METLNHKALTGVGQFMIALALFLFLPAWTLAYWQGWAYWFVVGLSVLFITLYFLKHDPALIKRRLSAGPGAEKTKNQQIIQTITSILLVFTIIGSTVDYGWRFAHVPTILVVIADMCVAIGFYIIFCVFKENTYTSAAIETDKNQKVISTGPYRVVRHPMYAGALVLFIATPLALSSFWGLIPAFLLAVMLGVRLLDEERYLTNHLRGYADYCKKIPYHLIPYIW